MRRATSHILGLQPPEDTSLSGRYDQAGWTVTRQGGGPVSLYLAGMATLHEAAHAELNTGSSWGAAILTCHIAHRHLGDPTCGSMVEELVRRARRTHESFATHTSVTAFDGTEVSERELLAPYPDYVPFYEAARALGPEPTVTPHWHTIAVNSALLACMQAPVLPGIIRHGVRGFWPPAKVLFDSDSPNARLTALRRLGPSMWHELIEIFEERMGRQWDYLRSVPRSDRDAVSSVGWEVWRHLQQVTYDASIAVLEALGFASVSVAEMQAQVQAIRDQLRPEIPHLDTFFAPSSRNDQLKALALFELENLVLHPPLPAKVTHWNVDTPPESLVSGAEPRRHIYVTARTAGRLRLQFALPPGALDQLPDNASVVAVQTRQDMGPDGSSVTLTLLDSPDLLRRLPRDVTDLGLVTNYSLACAFDTGWQARWLPEFARSSRTTTLFDRSILEGAKGLLEAGGDLRYVLIRVSVQEEQAFVLCMRLGDDPLLLAPCSLVAGRSLVSWIHLMSGSRLVPDLSVLGNDLDDVVPLVVDHLVRDESVIGFWP